MAAKAQRSRYPTTPEILLGHQPGCGDPPLNRVCPHRAIVSHPPYGLARRPEDSRGVVVARHRCGDFEIFNRCSVNISGNPSGGYGRPIHKIQPLAFTIVGEFVYDVHSGLVSVVRGFAGGLKDLRTHFSTKH
jgi:hypothetical protein